MELFGIPVPFTKASSYNQTYSFYDLFRGRGGRQSPQDTQGFVFTQQAGLTNSGETVSVDDLLNEATTVSCINAVSQGITQIPVYVRRIDDNGNYESLKNHPITKLMYKPNDFQTASEFKSSIVTSLLTHGNAFIRIVRAQEANQPTDGKPKQESIRGRPLALFILDPSDMSIGTNQFGKPTYTHEEYGSMRFENVIHIKDLTTFVPQGLSRALLAAEIIGAKKAADRLMAETFKNGISVQYAISSESKLDSSEKEAIVNQFKKLFGARGNRRGGAAFVGNAELTKLDGLTPADVDLRDLRERLILEIAAVFRVPAFMAGASVNQSYNNVRQYWTAFHRDTLQPLVKNIEEAITLKLLPTDNEYLSFDVQEILKGDVEITSRIAANMVSNGIWTPNEARASMGTPLSDDPNADILIPPNFTTNQNLEETPENATGGEDGPQGQENIDDR